MKRKYSRINLLSATAIMLLAVILIASACTPPPANTAPAAPAATSAVPAGPKSGGILKISTNLDANALGFPPRNTAYQDIGIARTSLEPLGYWNEKGDLVPLLADSWDSDANAKTITIKLKKGIKFHDGTDFNANAVKWNFQKYTEAGRPDIPKATVIDVVDDYTVKLTLPQWDSTVLTAITMLNYAGYMISPTAWQNAPGAASDKDRDTWSLNNPVGTGPFKLVNWQKTSKQVYKKNDNYWQKGKPYLDGIEWSFIPDPLVASAAFQAGDVDALMWIQPAAARDLQKQGFNIALMKEGNLVSIAVMGNSANPDSPFANIKMRQALSYAVDSNAISQLYYGFAGAIQQLAPPGSSVSSLDVKGYPFNPDKAKQLVNETYPNGVKVKLVSQNNPQDTAVATAIQKMLTTAGMNVELEPVEVARYIMMSNQASFDSLYLAYLRTDQELALQWSRIVSATSPQFVKSIIHPDDIEKLVTDGKRAPDFDAKKKISQQMQQLVIDKYCLFTSVVSVFPCAVKNKYMKGDKLMELFLQTQWTPENAWLDK